MTVREKVMIGLAACMPETEEETKIGCENCPYGCCKADAVRLPKQMIADIRAVLKAQEPRVLTLEEVKAAAGHDVWLELSGNYADDVLLAATIEGCGTKSLCTRYESFNYSAYGLRPYGWRCWTSRPTEEQRKAVAWE